MDTDVSDPKLPRMTIAPDGQRLFDAQYAKPLCPTEERTRDGWMRIGDIDHVRRRSLWVRLDGEGRISNPIELRAGREGSDAYVRIDADNPIFYAFQNVIETVAWALETSDHELSAKANPGCGGTRT